MTKSSPFRLHEDIALFREAVNFTVAQTGFTAHLIEKDYFCTVLLDYLTGNTGDTLVFKGGTCLAKVHAGFYRLSEDLDFTIPMPLDASRTQRRQAVAAIKDVIATIADSLPIFGVDQPLTGANNSVQYNGSLQYASPITGQPETTQIEISLREPLLTPTIQGQAKTILIDPIGGDTMLPDLPTNCISREEAIAEKFRAALSRRDVAIRDFYDLYYAVTILGLDTCDKTLINMVCRKLAIPGNPPLNISHERLADLGRQLDTRLKSVLRGLDYQQFHLDAAIGLVTEMAARLN